MRLFFGFPIADGTRNTIRQAAEDLEQRSPAVRLVPRENYHVTLHFLGEVSDSDIETCRDTLAAAVERSREPIVLNDLRIGSFPRSARRAPRVVTFAASECPAALSHLHKELGRSLEAEVKSANSGRGFLMRGGRLIPHVTIAYVKKRATTAALRLLPADIAELAAGLEPIGPVELKRLVLYQSTLTPNGSIYHELASASLSRKG